MSKIKTITASNCDEEKSDTYRLLAMVHRMAGAQACEKIGKWKIKSSRFDGDYSEVTWTNGVVDVKAVTINGDSHRYTLSAAEDSEQ